MAAPARRQQSLTEKLATAQAAIEEANRKLAELNARRNEYLLEDNDTEAIRLQGQIDTLTLEVRARRDKAQLLAESVREEERERRAKEREGQIERIEKKLAERDSAGIELADAVAAADRAFRKLIDVGAEIQNLWNWPASDVPACLLSHSAISAVLSHELYRVGGREKYGGGLVEKHGIHAGINIPGARVPRYELTHLREQIVPLTAVLKQASEHASNIMRGKKLSTPADVAAAVPVPATNGQNEPPPRSPAEQERDVALQELIRLAKDDSPQGELRYKAQLERVRQVEDTVASEQRVGAQGHG
jgi:hypothetical protein